MSDLKTVLVQSRDAERAVAHFNIADLVMLKAVTEAVRELRLPAIIGVSEGEREFMGMRQAVAMVKSLRAVEDLPIFLNADHTRSVEKAKAAIDAGFDAVIIDGSALPWEENVALAKEVATYARGAKSNVLIEGEIGYIGSGSEVIKELPVGAALTLDTITKAAEATRFVAATGVDLLSPAVGNIHGMFATGANPHLFIERIKEIRAAVDVPLVLHGGSGTPEEDFVSAIRAGISIIHISTELRRAWRRGIEAGLAAHPQEVAPYKILPEALNAVKEVVVRRMKLFSGLK